MYKCSIYLGKIWSKSTVCAKDHSIELAQFYCLYVQGQFLSIYTK